MPSSTEIGQAALPTWRGAIADRVAPPAAKRTPMSEDQVRAAIGAAFFALPRTVGSVREALTLLGVRTVRRWATVMIISAIPDVPDELVALALRRARMCEMLAGSALPEERETLFTIGLFSVADALLDAPMAEVLDSLPFTDEIQTALLRREGPKGELLSTVVSYERGEFPTLEAESGVSLAGAYRAALEWADEAHRAVTG